MAVRFRVNVVLTCAMAGLVTSCASSNEKANSSLAVRGAPQELQTIGERAGQIVMAAIDDDWPQVRVCVQDLCNAWQEYKYPTVASSAYPRPPAPLFRGPLDGWMLRLRFAAGKGQAQETMKAAQEVDAAALKLFEYYSPTTALDLRRLRMWEGRVVLNATQDQMDRASDALREARSTWGRVHRTIEAQSGPDTATTFENSLSAQRTAVHKRNPNTLVTGARQAIDAVNETLRSSHEEK